MHGSPHRCTADCIYWAIDTQTEQFVVAGAHASAAHKASTAANGFKTTFPDASRHVTIPVDGEGPVRLASRSGESIFLADIRGGSETLKRRDLFEQYRIRSVCFVPTIGGVLELGNTDGDDSAEWADGMPGAGTADLPTVELREALDVGGAAYVIFW